MLPFQGFCRHALRPASCAAVIFASSLGAAAQVPSGNAEPVQPNALVKSQAVGVADPGTTWPGKVVYYQIAPGSGDQANIATAIATFNSDFTGVIQWVNGTGSGTYVNINLDPNNTNGSCDVNSIGYPQYANTVVTMGGSGTCSVTTILHEMGHIVGLYHEFTRTDRDTYVTVNYGNVIKGSWTSDFAINSQNQQLLTPYDYASVMQYPSYVLSRNGGPVIETIPAGIPLQGTEGVPGAGSQDYSAADKEAILRLYGAAPTQVTVTSNPVGLQVVVDSATYTTPQTFSWTLNSTHTLSVASGVQTLTGDIENSTQSTTFYYTYGRWNDSTAQTHTITVSPGDGSPAFPTTKPAIATYSANFIQLVPYTATVYPSASGTVSVTPQPQTYSGASGSFFVARQPATLTATPATNYNFYEFNAQSPYFWLPGGISANPKTFNVPDTGNPVAVSAEFTTYPVFTVNVAPSALVSNEYSANLWAYVDSGFWRTPKSFSADPAFDGSAWSFSTSHTLNVDSPEFPYSVNTEYLFSSWSDNGAQLHSITVPGSSTTYTATVTPQYAPATNFSFPPCGGTAAITPASTVGGFYPWGTALTYTATPGSGWTFAGWTYDLNETTNPATLTATDETLVYANFNIAGAPLTLTGLSPSSAVAGSSTFTLTLTGTGFASNSVVIVNGNYLTPTFVSSTQLQVQVSSTLVASAGTFDVAVENYPAGSTGCAVFAYDTFTVTGVSLQTAATPAFSSAPGTYTSVLSVTISSTTPGASIYYTTDGSTPTTASFVYTVPITVPWSQTISAIAVANGYANSAVAIAAYGINNYSENVLVNMTAYPGAAPSAEPGYGNLIQGSDGNFYGTSYSGGANNDGTVFKVTPTGTYTLLHSFSNAVTDGVNPNGGLVQGTDGNFYGTTYLGGANGDGTVFKISSTGTLTLLHSFAEMDGTNPWAGLVQGTDGTFYGTTSLGGRNTIGTVFNITPIGTFDVLHSFAFADGAESIAGLVQGTDGNFYGTTSAGVGNSDGSVFKISSTGTFTLLHTFSGGTADGAYPWDGLVQAADGNFYGTTDRGGANGDGTIFKVSSTGAFTLLHSFSQTDGIYPDHGLTLGTDGNFYGTMPNASSNVGRVFESDATGTVTLLTFSSGPTDGQNPDAGLVQGADGSFYGTTSAGGTTGQGTVFKLVASPALPAPVALSVPASVPTGSSFTLSYSVANAYSETMQQCFATNNAGDTTGWAGIKTGTPTAANANLTAPSTAGSYTYTLTCGGIESSSTTLNVTALPPPFGYLDEAVDSVTGITTVSPLDSLLVSGWAADPTDGAPLSNVKVYVDGTSIGTPTLGLSRPDVAAAYNNSAYTNSGFQLTYPAASLSVGTHSVTVVAIDSGARSTTFGPLTINVTSPQLPNPFGYLDRAVDSVSGSTTVVQSDSLLVSGWAADVTDGAPLSNVKVYVDGTLFGTPTLGIARPDVAAAYSNSAYTNSGYQLVHSAASLSTGTHSVTVVAIDSGGRSTTFGPNAITVTPPPLPPPFGYLDIAADSVTYSTTVSQSDSLLVKGWVADATDGAPLSNVKVYVDGTSIGTPTLGLARADVASAYGNSAYTNSGFQLLYPATSLSVGAHSVTVIAIDSGARSTTFGPIAITVTAPPPPPPFGYLDRAVDSVSGTTTVSQSHSLLVSGWTADVTDGAPLSNVKVYVDGTLFGTPTLGIARSDVAAAYSNTAYTDSGFQLLHSASSLSTGTHSVTVVAIDSGARSTTFGPIAITVGP